MKNNFKKLFFFSAKKNQTKIFLLFAFLKNAQSALNEKKRGRVREIIFLSKVPLNGYLSSDYSYNLYKMCIYILYIVNIYMHIFFVSHCDEYMIIINIKI